MCLCYSHVFFCFCFFLHRHTKQKKIYVISTMRRPVPLQHYLYTGNSKQTQDQLFMIVNENRQFLNAGLDIGYRGYHFVMHVHVCVATRMHLTLKERERNCFSPKLDQKVELIPELQIR